MNESTLVFIFQYLPWWLLGIWTGYSFLCFVSKSFRERVSNIYVFESIPSVFITLGLLGTFAGITYGLLKFNTSPEVIKASIQLLLDGLKSAMFSTIAGVILSLITSKIVQVMVARESITIPESTELQELKLINENLILFKDEIRKGQTEGLKKGLESVLSEFNIIMDEFVTSLVEKNFQELSKAVNQLVTWQVEHKNDVEQLIIYYRELVQRHSLLTEKTEEWVMKMDEVAGQSSNLQKIIDEFDKSFSEEGNLSQVLTSIKESTENLATVTNHFKGLSNDLSNTTSVYSATGDRVKEWTESISRVSDASSAIVDRVSTLRGLDTEKLDHLFASIDELFLKYIETLEMRLAKNEKI